MPREKATAFKLVTLFAILDMAWFTSMSLTSATACQNSLMLSFGSDPSMLYIVYWLPTVVHLMTVLMTFNCYSRAMLIVSVGFGVAAVIWHIICLITYTSSP